MTLADVGVRGRVIVCAVPLVTETCFKCGVAFAMAEDFEQRRRRDHQSFYCPAGHPQFYPGESDLERERRLRGYAERRAENLADNLRCETLSHRATKGQLTKTRKRVAHGVCPCCKRTFASVERHMASQHPEFVAEHTP